MKFTPLLLLLLLIWNSQVGNLVVGTASHTQIAALRYFAIPLVGFSLGFTVFLWARQREIKLGRLKSFVKQYNIGILLLSCCIFYLFFFSLSTLRYITLHTTTSELGWYDNKVWNISQSSSFFEALRVASTGYFQPILVIHGYLYKFSDSPIFLQFLQTGAVVSGVIPLYLIAKEKFPETLWTIVFVILYLLYPPVEYNATMEFHPDHLLIPLLLWAFYFAEQGKYWQSVVFAGIGGLAKEPLILVVAFFGLYIFFDKGKKWIGLWTFLIYLILFFVVIFMIQPVLTPYYKNIGSVLGGSNFAYLLPSNSGNVSDYISNVIHGVSTWKSRKILLIVFLLLPFLFLPLLRGFKFIPALPPLFISMLSLYPAHSGVDMQYTVAVIPSVFVGLIFALARVRQMFGEMNFVALFLWIFIMMATLDIAHSPSPLSPNYWDSRWSEVWYYGVYQKTARYEDMEKIISLIPPDPKVKVVSQNNINSSKLSHRIHYWIFPERWEEADYILLDTWNPVIPIDVKYTPREIYTSEKYFTVKQNQEQQYSKVLSELKASGRYHLVLEKDGLILFERKK